MAKPATVLLLDPLRFACALFVVLHHYGAVLPASPPPLVVAAAARIDLSTALAAWTWPGWIGVEVFFVLSGYVIAGSVAGLAASGAGVRQFVRRRAMRLLPAAWLCATATAAVTLALGEVSPADVYAGWSRALLLIPGDPPIDGSYWTLPIEVAFYALVAAALHARIGADALLVRVGALLTLASAAFWSARLAGWVGAPDRYDLLLLPHGAFFATGMWLSRLHAGRATRAQVAWLAVAMAAGGVQIADRSTALAQRFALPDRPLVPLALFVAAVALVASAPAWQRALARLGSARLRFLGLASYPLYLLHQNIGAAAIVGLRAIGWGMGASIAATTLAMIVAAAAVARWAEPWLRARLEAVILTPPRRRAPPPGNRPIASPPAG